jgi:hypothetical protein
MSSEQAPPPLQMLGAPDAAVCEDDSCLLPDSASPAGEAVEVEDDDRAALQP